MPREEWASAIVSSCANAFRAASSAADPKHVVDSRHGRLQRLLSDILEFDKCHFLHRIFRLGRMGRIQADYRHVLCAESDDWLDL